MTRKRFLLHCVGYFTVGMAISLGAIGGLYFLGKAVGLVTGQ